MRMPKSYFEKLQLALAASVMVLAVAPALAADAAQPAASGFVPTLADYLSIYDALQHYRIGVQEEDQKEQQAAFWPDAARGGGGGGRGAGGPPPGADAGPPAGGAPGAGGARRGPPPNWEEIKKMPGFVQVWHLPLDSYIHFDSATRATHYEYFLSIYPQPEKKAPEGGSISNMEARTSIVGWPGHYEDILEKRNGEWRILQRKMGMNER